MIAETESTTKTASVDTSIPVVAGSSNAAVTADACTVTVDIPVLQTPIAVLSAGASGHGRDEPQPDNKHQEQTDQEDDCVGTIDPLTANSSPVVLSDSSSSSASKPLIRLISFESFKACGTFPRFPENQDITLNAEAIDAERDTSLVVFVSHGWLRGWSGAPGYDGKPHPDNAQGSKFQLIVAAVELAMKALAPGMTQCYLWCDFGCLDQDNNPAGQLKQLDKIMQLCDCLLTPIVDDDWATWMPPSSISSWYEEYKSKLWCDGKYAYLNRGWCRLEMFYGAAVPLLPNSPARMDRFDAGLKSHLSNGHRCHMLYGDWNVNMNYGICILPPLQHSYLDRYHPSKGNLQEEPDRVHITRLVKQLEPYMGSVKAGYEGEYKGTKRHGHGIYRFADGEFYEGAWRSDEKHGHGVFRFADGSVYEGAFKNDQISGQGTYCYADGSSYSGAYQDGYRHGQGIYRFADGRVYEGLWENGRMHGRGVMTHTNGSVYEGEFRDDQMHGNGVMTHHADGTMYTGEYRHDSMHGLGNMKFADGSEYEGEWINDKMHGTGAMIHADGSVYDGEWQCDERHGTGTYQYEDGSKYEGEWKRDKRHGKGVRRYTDGREYEGEWRNDRRLSKGVYPSRYHDADSSSEHGSDSESESEGEQEVS